MAGLNSVRRVAIGAALCLLAGTVKAAEYPAPKDADFVLHDFKFHDGKTLPELRMHYTTIGNPSLPPVLVLHGSAGSGPALLTPAFAGELFGPGQPLDATKYFLILPDGIGHGKSAKPSDGLGAKFPEYDYADMVEAQYRLLEEGLGIHHVRLVFGYSMGGMHVWLWGEKHPDFMDALVPMAAQPSPMAARNWMLRRLMLDIIRNDPAYGHGIYTQQPPSVRVVSAFFNTATAGGTLAYQHLAPTRAAADKLVDDRLAAPFTTDANDFVWLWNASGDYDPSADLEKIKAPLLLINAADDERNPPETGITERELKRVKNGHLYLIPASEDTRGHATNVFAKFYAKQLGEFMQTLP